MIDGSKIRTRSLSRVRVILKGAISGHTTRDQIKSPLRRDAVFVCYRSHDIVSA